MLCISLLILLAQTPKQIRGVLPGGLLAEVEEDVFGRSFP